MPFRSTILRRVRGSESAFEIVCAEEFWNNGFEDDGSEGIDASSSTLRFGSDDEIDVARVLGPATVRTPYDDFDAVVLTLDGVADDTGVALHFRTGDPCREVVVVIDSHPLIPRQRRFG